MAFSRRLGVVGIVGASWLVAVACSDSNDKTKVAGEAGAGGEAPSGGKSNAGGSSSNAGKGGMATAGEGGASGGGGMMSGAGSPAAGEAGAAGTPGVTPTGGAGGGDAGGGGGDAGGAGGAGGAAAVTALSCTYPCTTDDDCAVLPDDASRQCDPIIHQCRTPQVDDGCVTIRDCIPQGNFLAPCASEQDCNVDLEACVTYRGSGYCAPLADPQTGCDATDGTTQDTVNNFGTTGTSNVCLDLTAAACIAGSCGFSCNFLDGCAAGGGTCNQANGLCECQTDDECGTGKCGADHQCVQCQISDDCAAGASDTGLDVCVDGKCGCSSAASCVNPGFQGAPPVCQ